MKSFCDLIMRRFLRSERGQSAVFVVLTASTMMALAAAAVETGHVYYAYQRLVASTNAAALAGAQGMPNTTLAATNVTNYSAQSNGLNATGLLKNVVATPTFVCSSGVVGSFNVACQTASGASGGYNAVKVTQTATIPMWFGGLIGMRQMNVAATAEAAMRGGTNNPWNIAIILDATPSMGYQDNGMQCSGTQLYCAQQGIQALLNLLYPCQLGQTCSSTGSKVVDSVTLFVFPAVTTSTAYKDYTCNAGSPSAVAYTFPDPPSNTVLPTGDTYQTVTWANDYRTSDTATSLNKSSHIVNAAGGSATSGWGGNSCPGVQTRMEWTYYAQVIYAAQAALTAQQAANPNSQNAIIILSDGDATACASNANTTAGACNNSPISLIAGEGTLNGTGTSTTNPTGYRSYAYPSALGECGQAVLAAQAAAQAGTAVYTIGYGSPVSGSCKSDHTYSASVTTNGGTWGPGKQGCDALAAMASAPVNFYSDDGQGCQATVPSNQNLTKLTAIFRAITNNLTNPRLIPAGT
jgi:Flp pilus assembly protein TadG